MSNLHTKHKNKRKHEKIVETPSKPTKLQVPSVLKRAIEPSLISDLSEKMVFLGGPRQVGKTTLSQNIFPDRLTSYLNWDDLDGKKLILEKGWSAESSLVILDEIHKYKKWRNLVKGYYDTLKKSHHFLVTGSARLDSYRKGGDSLLGRYYYYRLHPLSVYEIESNNKFDLNHLLKFGGFPESFLKGTEKNLRRWHAQRNQRIIYSDVRDLENVREISLIELLMTSLPERVGSPLSKANLARDLEVDFKTIEKWLLILENVYYCFRISPFGAPKIRAVRKEQKLYLWDWSELENPGARWENFVASHLLKYCHFHEDTEGHKMELRFLRDHFGREIDFVVIKNKKPLFAVECKTSEKSVSPHIKYFSERTNIPEFYQVHQGTKHYKVNDQTTVIPFEKFSELVLKV